jgi:hypothetical protein
MPSVLVTQAILMPTYEAEPAFFRDLDHLTNQERNAFFAAVRKFVADLNEGDLRAGLRVKAMPGHPGVYEMSWAPDGRATFSFGASVKGGQPHIIWRRIGTHDIFDRP